MQGARKNLKGSEEGLCPPELTRKTDQPVCLLLPNDPGRLAFPSCADIVLRAWERRSEPAAREGLGVVVLMTAETV